MKRMFASATLKLTGWYLIILVLISLLFSFIIYELATFEISTRLERLQIRIEGTNQTITLPGPASLDDVRLNQTNEAKASIFVGLVYMNIAVISLGGIGSFLLARRTLKPIAAVHDAQSRFTSDASHELRTPLAIMKSEIQVALREKNLSSTDFRELLESNLEEVDRLTRLSASLLQLSRLEYDEVNRDDRIDIIQAISGTLKTLRIPKKRVLLNAPSQLPIIDGNEPMILDLFRILFDNAVKYSPAESPIKCDITSNGRTCKITISNEGEGIDGKDIERIFDRFYRGEKSRTVGSSGYGLGLSLAKKIILLHDGSISVKSKKGELTSFTVSLAHVRKNR